MYRNNTRRLLIGKGLRFPYSATQNKGVAFSEEIERINHSLLMIFETPKGSRLMNPAFGSDLLKYRFDPFDDILLTKIRETITRDIEMWEPRIIITSIKFLDSDIAKDNSILYIYIDYRIINTETEGNFVYPYKLETYDTPRTNYID